MPVYIDCHHGHMIDIDWCGVENDEIKTTDIHAVLDIVVYTKWLQEQPMEKQLPIAKALDNILEIRGWFHEVYMQTAANFPTVVIGTHKNMWLARQAALTTTQLRGAVKDYVKSVVAMLGLSVSED